MTDRRTTRRTGCSIREFRFPLPFPPPSLDVTVGDDRNAPATLPYPFHFPSPPLPPCPCNSSTLTSLPVLLSIHPSPLPSPPSPPFPPPPFPSIPPPHHSHLSLRPSPLTFPPVPPFNHNSTTSPRWDSVDSPVSSSAPPAPPFPPLSSPDSTHVYEVDRLLRPNGVFILAGQPVAWRGKIAEWKRLRLLGKALCWELLKTVGNVAVWRKLGGEACRVGVEGDGRDVPLCSPALDPDDACAGAVKVVVDGILAQGGKEDDAEEDRESGRGGGGGAREGRRDSSNNPQRRLLLSVNEEREGGGSGGGGSGGGGETEQFKLLSLERKRWRRRLLHYQKLFLGPLLSSGRVRNVLDMNAGIGGLAAALEDEQLKAEREREMGRGVGRGRGRELQQQEEQQGGGVSPVWVMNVVPSTGPNTLPAIYDRGLVGTVHDWCESFSSYPRTYDLIHLLSTAPLIPSK
ncbi:unnamed protein product [Closterium sp. NIES-54]